MDDGFLSVEAGNTSLPSEFAIKSVHPNPFNSTTTITYSLHVNGSVNIGLFDVTGRLIRQLSSGMETAGTHSLTLSDIDISSGIYIVSLETDAARIQQKIVLVK